MVRAGWVGVLRAALCLVALGWGPAARAGAGVASAFDALGGLRGPLEAQGWSLATDRSSAISPGDIYDPVDQQVQVYGKACFALDTLREGVAPSMEVDRALQASGKVKLGLWGVGASGHGSVDAQITSSRIAEVAVADLEPSEACARQLQDLAGAGANVASWVVVQSTLTTDLQIDVCGGGEVGVSAEPAGKVSVGLDSCRKTQGTSVVLAIRPEPLHTVLAAAKVPLPSTGLPMPAPKKKRKEDKEPPCWLTAPCLPYVEPVFSVAVAKGATPGAADNAARERLLEPYERQRQAVRDLGLGDPPEPLAAEAVTVAARYKDDQAYYSLLVLDRSAVHARLDAHAALARAALEVPLPEHPVGKAQALARTVPVARELGWWEAELAVLRGDPPVIAPYADRVEQQKRAIAAVGVRPPAGPASGPVSTALERAGVRVVAGPKEPADLVLGLTAPPPETREIQGFTSVTHRGVLELRAGAQLVGSVDVEAAASSQDRKRAAADAASALNDRVAELAVGLVEEVLGLRGAPTPIATFTGPAGGSPAARAPGDSPARPSGSAPGAQP